MVWVSWPKKAAKVPTDVTENTIRDVALPMGWVDVKVCAVDETWSGSSCEDCAALIAANERLRLRDDLSTRMGRGPSPSRERSMPLALATLVAGTLDILFAFVVAGAVAPRAADRRQRPARRRDRRRPGGRAARPAGPLRDHGRDGRRLVRRRAGACRRSRRHWIVAGLLYGVVLWIVMYWIVMPLRWDSYTTPSEPVPIARQLFAHCVLVGLPIAWFAARHFKVRPSFN